MEGLNANYLVAQGRPPICGLIVMEAVSGEMVSGEI
jgi:hypothetical protein